MVKTRRFRPTAIDRLPDEALSAVQAAYDAIVSRRQDQEVLRDKLHAELRALGITHTPVSRSAFNRWAIRVRSGMVPRPGIDPMGLLTAALETIVRNEVRRRLALAQLRPSNGKIKRSVH
ncbi:DUF3486 family protein [Paradevosia shaoguanensis]|uniref:DUF3486 family protein n=1 Tax=Paradevosia shaoguanensis TaxID=1335043 RepID=A0AA41QJN6_9HYPH|nr:DUF3486 family protein [Paradevosia shaoguanensis]MCF1741255.1 DUF3486 family protein [Paradevosia shaoguanensis]MCI0125738.1 DUF3486 family protein [Paradevosia shaoguanensis]